MTSAAQDELIQQFEQRHQLEGTEEIALTIRVPKNWLLILLRRLSASGQITIIQSNGGRGKKTIYKRNRNSAGQAMRQ